MMGMGMNRIVRMGMATLMCAALYALVARAAGPGEDLTKAAREEIERNFSANEADVRVHAVEAAREGLGSAARDHLIKSLEDSAGTVRFAAALAIGELKLAAAKARLEQMLND